MCVKTNISEMIKLYSACIACPKIGQICKGPNFFAMPLPEIIGWMIARKKHLGWTQERLSLESGVPAGTIARVLSGKITDVKFETLSPLLRALTGSDCAELPCPDPDDNLTEQLRARCRHLEQELADTKQLADRVHESHASSHAHLTGQTNNLRKALSVMTALLIVVLFGIICVLLYDINHLDIGYFRG